MEQSAGAYYQFGPYLGVIRRLAEDDGFYKECKDDPTKLLAELNATAKLHNETGFDSDVYDSLEGGIAPQEDYQQLLAEIRQPLDPLCIARMFHPPTPPGCPPPPPGR
jgi:hypothetical protein